MSFEGYCDNTSHAKLKSPTSAAKQPADESTGPSTKKRRTSSASSGDAESCSVSDFRSVSDVRLGDIIDDSVTVRRSGGDVQVKLNIEVS